MDLFEKVKEVSELVEKANKAKEELMSMLKIQFLNFPYQMKIIEAGYDEHPYGNQSIIKVYYPVLDVPTGFVKEDETFYREFANCIKHEYTLKDEEGRKVQIEEHGTFDHKVHKSAKGAVELRNCIISPEIKYGISISGERYNFVRKILYKDMLEQILEVDRTARYKENYYSEQYKSEEEKYEQFLKKLGATNKLPTLEELYESKQNEIQITPEIKANVNIQYEEKYSCVWLNNPKFDVRLDNIPHHKIIIELCPYLGGNIKLEQQKYRYDKLLNEEKLREGITLEEAIKII